VAGLSGEERLVVGLVSLGDWSGLLIIYGDWLKID